MIILKLTERRNAEEFSIYVNMEQVQYFNKSFNGADTRLKIEGNAYIFVKETPEDILNLMSANPMPQVMIDDIKSGRIRSLK